MHTERKSEKRKKQEVRHSVQDGNIFRQAKWLVSSTSQLY